MHREEAIKVLYAIHDVCQQFFMSCVSLDRPSSQITEAPDGYEIRMKCDVDSNSRKCIKPILDKYNLLLREENGFVILYRQ
jgi:hypothetical protein